MENEISFKEQSWKIMFATIVVLLEPSEMVYDIYVSQNGFCFCFRKCLALNIQPSIPV